MSDQLFAKVAFPIPVPQVYTYTIPDKFASRVTTGFRVLAPFGRKKITGFVVDVSKKSDITNPLPISDLLDSHAVFSQEMLSTAIWISEYYMAPIGQTLAVMLPPGMDQESQIFVMLKENVGEYEIEMLTHKRPAQAKILKALYVYRQLTQKELEKKTGVQNLTKQIAELLKFGVIEQKESIEEPEISVRFEKYVAFAEAYRDEPERLVQAIEKLKNSPKQTQLLSFMGDLMTAATAEGELPEVKQSELLKTTGVLSGSLKSLVDKGLLISFEKEVIRNPFDRVYPKLGLLRLNEEQEAAVFQIEAAINQQHFQTFLLHGITGSGKTQIYIEAIRRVLEQGKTAIVLVPEISLTPQAVERYKGNFEDKVTVLHSALSRGERFDSWRKLRSGHFRVVIGARSAVFAPVQNLGLIVIDEEHENTYKQADTNPKYHARDVAVMRGSFNHAVVILGSATPSVESYYNAETGKYKLIHLSKRIGDVPLPEVQIVNMREERKIHTDNWQPIFSVALRDEMRKALRNHQQIILYQNRRGYATYIECFDCGFVAECPHCSITLTYHIHQNKLRCHYCGHVQDGFRECPQCLNANILNHGIGTQKVEELLKETFPKNEVIRMDLDTTGTKGAHHKILEKFKNNEAQILLGTQMVAKGLDFENVTVVGVISADTSLLFPDFRASERTFQLLTQVAGRAGRKEKKGRVIIQSFNPERAAIKHSQDHDFESFYHEEIGYRKELMYPPYGRLALVLIRGLDEKKVIDHASRFSDILHVETAKRIPSQHIHILGPTAAPITRIRNQYRWHIIIKTNKTFDRSGALTREVIASSRRIYGDRLRTSSVELVVDIDPYSLL